LSLPERPLLFDRVYGPEESTRDIYTSVVESRVAHALAGFNAAIIAYGQTCSGKTTTIRGGAAGEGLVPLCTRQVIGSVTDGTSVLLSYLEVYNESVTDLLTGQTNLSLFERKATASGGGGGCVVHGLREVRVSSMEEAAALLRRGDERRTIAATDQNERSSRAHTIFRLRIVRPFSDSVLSLVDLCGSERRSAHVQGSPRDVRSGEAGSINKSLLALGQVVSKLCEAGRASVQGTNHVPYRASKITRLLQESLGGESLSTIVCTVTPAASQAEETASTLRFGSKASRVLTRPRVQVTAVEAPAVLQLREELVGAREEASIAQASAAEARAEAARTQEEAGETLSVALAEVAEARAELDAAHAKLMLARGALVDTREQLRAAAIGLAESRVEAVLLRQRLDALKVVHDSESDGGTGGTGQREASPSYTPIGADFSPLKARERADEVVLLPPPLGTPPRPTRAAASRVATPMGCSVGGASPERDGGDSGGERVFSRRGCGGGVENGDGAADDEEREQAERELQAARLEAARAREAASEAWGEVRLARAAQRWTTRRSSRAASRSQSEDVSAIDEAETARVQGEEREAARIHAQAARRRAEEAEACSRRRVEEAEMESLRQAEAAEVSQRRAREAEAEAKLSEMRAAEIEARCMLQLEEAEEENRRLREAEEESRRLREAEEESRQRREVDEVDERANRLPQDAATLDSGWLLEEDESGRSLEQAEADANRRQMESMLARIAEVEAESARRAANEVSARAKLAADAVAARERADDAERELRRAQEQARAAERSREELAARWEVWISLCDGSRGPVLATPGPDGRRGGDRTSEHDGREKGGEAAGWSPQAFLVSLRKCI